MNPFIVTSAKTFLAVLIGCSVLALSSGIASANTAHEFSQSFGGLGSGAGQLDLRAPGDGVAGSGVAVNDETHQVYVADTENNRVDVFSDTGQFVLTFGAGVNKTKVEGGAATAEEEDLCTAVEIETEGVECQAGTAGSEPGELEAPTFVAVDNESSSLSHGDVYVAGPGLGYGQETTDLVAKYSASGVLQTRWGNNGPGEAPNGQLNGASAPPTPTEYGTIEGRFGEIAGLAVGASGHLWVYVGATAADENVHMYEWDQAGGFLQAWEPTELNTGSYSPQSIGVGGREDLYASEVGRYLFELAPDGTPLGEVLEVRSGEPNLTWVTADPADNVYVDRGAAVEHFPPSCRPEVALCTPAETFGSSFAGGGELSGGAGVAVDSSSGANASGAAYVLDTAKNRVDVFAAALEAVTGSALDVRARTATVNATVNPEGSQVTDCEFEYGQSEEYGHRVPCEAPDAAEVGSGTSSVAVHASLAGLEGGVTYHYRVVAKNVATGGSPLRGEDRELTTPPTPLIAGAAAVDVTTSSALLQATVNPKGFPVSSCVFEYGTTSAYGASVACAPASPLLGEGTAPMAVSAELAGLSADTEYHWRLVAENQNGSSAGSAGSEDHTFVYDTTGGALPDGREYEMVTPPAKNGALIGHVVIGTGLNFSADGNRLVAPSIQCFAAAEGCTGERQQEGEPYEFTRTPSGWVTTPLAPPANEFRASSAWEVGAEDGVALFSMPTEPGGEDDFYARTPEGTFKDIGPGSPPGTSGVPPLGVEAKEGTADLSHLVYQANGGLWPFDATTPGGSLYEYAGFGNAEPFLVEVTGTERSTELIGRCGALLGSRADASALSSDGRIVDFTVETCEGGGTGTNAGVSVPVAELYARVDGESSAAHTVAISEPDAPQTASQNESDRRCISSACLENTSPASQHAAWKDARYWAASSDGSRILFSSGQQLTDEASQGSANLYMYDFDSPEGERLIDVSAGDTSGTGPAVQGVVAFSPDGSHAYFVAQGLLTSMPNGQGESAEPGQHNLYVYERDARYPEGHIAFIAALPGSPGEIVESGANVTPDGRFLVFESTGALTPDDTRSDGSTQLFRYDAQSEELVRISIGDRGYNDNGNAGTGGVSIRGEYGLGFPRSDPTMSNDGAYVFFQSPIALTPHALNDVPIGVTNPQTNEPEYAQNIYEFHEGRVYLISDGRDTANTLTPCAGGRAVTRSSTCLIGADATGSSVFFTTADQLLPTDTDTQLDIYDARICTASSPCVHSAPPALPPCLGEACHGIPAAAPLALVPGSATFNGQGNLNPLKILPTKKGSGKRATRTRKLAKALRACHRRRRRRRRNACRKAARRKFRPSTAGNAHRRRRIKR